MSTADIPDLPILKFLSGPFDGWPAPGWGTWYWSDYGYQPANSVVRAMPAGTTADMALQKMVDMIERGLVNGCPCGCRGDFEITVAGEEYLKANPLDALHNLSADSLH